MSPEHISSLHFLEILWSIMALLALEDALKEESPEIWKVAAVEVAPCQCAQDLSIPVAAEVRPGEMMHVTVLWPWRCFIPSSQFILYFISPLFIPSVSSCSWGTKVQQHLDLGFPNRPGSATHCWQNQVYKRKMWDKAWWVCAGGQWRSRWSLSKSLSWVESCWLKAVLTAWSGGLVLVLMRGCFVHRVFCLN